jgi:hypothetical protein
MTSTMVECLQGTQMAKEATVPDKNGSGNPMIRYEHFTRADDANTRYAMCSNCHTPPLRHILRMGILTK